MTTTARERLTQTINHIEPDRLCVDFGAGGQTGIGAGSVRRLRKVLIPGADDRVRIIEPFQMLGEVDPQLQDALHLDVIGIPTPSDMLGLSGPCDQSFTMCDGTVAKMPSDFRSRIDPDGNTYAYPQGDESVAPSVVMPRGGYFFDATDRQLPFEKEDLDPADHFGDFGLLSEEDLEYYHQKVGHAHNQTERGIYVTIGGLGFGDIALVPATWRKETPGIRNVEQWFMSPLIRPGFVHAIFEKQLEIGLKNIDLLANTLGDKVQVAFITGTDFGTQNSLFISKESYREFFKPYHKVVCDKIHAVTNWKTFIHSCGAIIDLIPDFIEAGFDILNPVQCSATGMDPQQLKREFGKEIVFWGGGVDTQQTLPFGTPEEVYREVRERIDIFAPGGGFVFNSIHNVQSDVPTPNLLAMFRALNDARNLDFPEITSAFQ